MKNSAQQQDEVFERMTKAREARPAQGRGRKWEEPTPPLELVIVWNKLPLIERLHAVRAWQQQQRVTPA